MTTNTNTINTLDTTDIDVVVLANGEYPCNEIPLSLINRGIPIVCCDGAIAKLDQQAIAPIAVIGDGDSISQHLKDKYQSLWHYIADQETNDPKEYPPKKARSRKEKERKEDKRKT